MGVAVRARRPALTAGPAPGRLTARADTSDDSHDSMKRSLPKNSTTSRERGDEDRARSG